VAKRPADKATITPPPQVTVPFKKHSVHERSETTTATSTVSFCTVVTGCGESEIDKTDTVEELEKPRSYVVIPRDPKGVSDALKVTIAFLSDKFYESRTDALGTLFFFIPSLTTAQVDRITAFAEVAETYTPRGVLTHELFPDNPANIPEDPGEEPPSFFKNVTNFNSNGTYMRTPLAREESRNCPTMVCGNNKYRDGPRNGHAILASWKWCGEVSLRVLQV
jgi:hypothetical protein